MNFKQWQIQIDNNIESIKRLCERLDHDNITFPRILELYKSVRMLEMMYDNIKS